MVNFLEEREVLFVKLQHVGENIRSLIKEREEYEETKRYYTLLLDVEELKEKDSVNNAEDPETKKPKYSNQEKRDIALQKALASNETYSSLKTKLAEVEKKIRENAVNMRINEWNFKVAKEQTSLVTGGIK